MLYKNGVSERADIFGDKIDKPGVDTQFAAVDQP